MKQLILSLFIFLTFSNIVKGQLSSSEKCYLYTFAIENIKNQNIQFVLGKGLMIINDFNKYYSFVLPAVYKDSLEIRNIDYLNYSKTTNDILFNCNNSRKIKKIKKIKESRYSNKIEKYSKKKCYLYIFSNIAYNKNNATYMVILKDFNGATYIHHYFFRKNDNWQLVYDFTWHD